MGLGLVFDIFDLEGVGIPLGLGPIPVAVWAVDEGEITDLGMWDYDPHDIIVINNILLVSLATEVGVLVGDGSLGFGSKYCSSQSNIHPSQRGVGPT